MDKTKLTSSLNTDMIWEYRYQLDNNVPDYTLDTWEVVQLKVEEI